VNEAFASVPLVWLREFDVDPAAVNPRGGAIALGHPLGASGTRLLTTLLGQLDATADGSACRRCAKRRDGQRHDRRATGLISGHENGPPWPP